MTRDELHAELMKDDTEYCCYCGCERRGVFACCGENHFETYAQMQPYAQEELLDWEEWKK